MDAGVFISENERYLSVYAVGKQTESLLHVPGARVAVRGHDERFGLQIQGGDGHVYGG